MPGVPVDGRRFGPDVVTANEAQPGLPHSPLVLRAIARAHDTRLDALATVVAPGELRVGESVVLR
ncbi:hypothetical protein [Streptantibioticus cattleyicolor]|uniref:hypothetical protein n=1 Tax=Streptantibioticus cattleyicolor TaxID=29303 RepID=UPI000213EBF9